MNRRRCEGKRELTDVNLHYKLILSKEDKGKFKLKVSLPENFALGKNKLRIVNELNNELLETEVYILLKTMFGYRY